MLQKALGTNAFCTVMLLVCAYINTQIDAKLAEANQRITTTKTVAVPSAPVNWRHPQATVVTVQNEGALAEREYYEGIQYKFLAFIGLPTVVGLLGSLAVIGCCCVGRLFGGAAKVAQSMPEMPAPEAVPDAAPELPDFFKKGLQENAPIIEEVASG